jgi:hypothetical protein
MSNPITANLAPAVGEGQAFRSMPTWIDPEVIGEDPGEMVDPVSAAD